MKTLQNPRKTYVFSAQGPLLLIQAGHSRSDPKPHGSPGPELRFKKKNPQELQKLWFFDVFFGKPSGRNYLKNLPATPLGLAQG